MKLDIDKYYEKGKKYYLNWDYNKALKYFKKGYDVSKHEDFLNYIGCCYLNLNKFQYAASVFKELMKICLNWERPVFNLGRVYLELKMYSKALEYFNKAVLINSDDEDVYYYLGLYFEKTCDYKSAIFYYEKSLSLNDFQPETHLNLGVCYYRFGNLSGAENCFNEVLKNYSLNSKANKFLKKIYAKK